MAKKCPDCGTQRIEKIKNLMLCPECGYREIPADIDKGWLGSLARDMKLWDKSVIESIPFLLAGQYEEVNAAATQGSAYRTAHALEELILLLIRFPVLCAAAMLEEESIDRMLTEKELSAAGWVNIAQAELKCTGALPQPISDILVKTVALFCEQGLSEDRTDMLMQSSRAFVESKALCDFVEKTLLYVARYFKDARKSFEAMSFALKKHRGPEGKLQENIILTVCEFKGTVQPYILLRQEELFLFEGMNRDRKRSIYRNFTTGLLLERVVPFFRDLCAPCVRTPFEPAYRLTTEQTRTRLMPYSTWAEYAGAEEFEKWLKDSMTDRGVLVYQSPALTGKSILADALSPSAPAGQGIGLDGVIAVVYRCDQRNTQRVGTFISGLYYTLSQCPVAEYAEFEISGVLAVQPTLSLDGPDAIAAMLNEYKARFPEQKLLVVIDGLDKIPQKSGEIFRCLPKKEELSEGVFLLLTCRNEADDDNEALKQFVSETAVDAHVAVQGSPEYESMVRRFIDAHVRIRVGKCWKKLTEEETGQLLHLSEKNLPDIRLYAALLAEGGRVDELPAHAKLFDAYTSAMHERMGARRFRPAIRMLAAVASAAEPIDILELCELFEYSGISPEVVAQLEEVAPFLRVIMEGNTVRLALANPDWASKILGIFPEMIGDVLGHVAMCVLDATEEDVERPSEVTAFCFANIMEYIRIYGNKSMLDVLCKYKIYYKLIQMSKFLFSGTPNDLLRREEMLVSAELLLRHAADRDMLRATTFNTRGNFHTSLCRYRDAREDYTTSIRLGEKCCREFQMTNENLLASAYINRGAIHRLFHQKDEAIADYARAIELRKRLFFSKRITDEKELAIVHLYYAQALRDKELWSQAAENYTSAIEIWEKLYATGYYTDAYNLADTYYSRAEMLKQDGRSFEEVMDYSRAIEVLLGQKQPSFSEKGLLRTLYLRRADLHEELGNTPAAESDKQSAQAL